MALFKLKEDESTEIEITSEEVEEIVPDADFRFSLLILKNGNKHFIYGTEAEVSQDLKGAS
jgi:hypothetical protein